MGVTLSAGISRRLPPLLCYALAIVCVGAAALLTHLLHAYIERAPLTLFYLAIVVCAVYGNSRGGVLALALSLAGEFLLQRAREQPAPALYTSLALFGVVAAILVLLVHRLRQSEARFGGLLATATDAIIVLDSRQHIVLFNPAAEALLQCPAKQAIGQPIARFFAATAKPGGDPLREDDSNTPHEISGRRADGSELPLETSISRIRFGGHALTTLILRDIRVRKEHEREIERLNRLYAALSQINEAIVRDRSREELLRKVCQVLVKQGQLSLAWIGWHNPDTQQLEPLAEWGDADGYIRNIRVFADDRPEGRGPSGRAFRERRPYICNDLLTDPNTLPWRSWIVLHGFRACAALPIRQKGEVRGMLTVYAADAGFFRDKEMALLDEAAADISFALDNLAREQERQCAEHAAQHERAFADAIIASLPGILYLYDEQGRFLRWNNNFLAESGYSADELAHMHPTQFFAGADVQRVAERIARVFSDGHSSVEAAFVAKDGSATPYFFTGQRLTFAGNPCLVGVGIDIGERVQAERQLAHSELKYRELVELANSIILRWSPDGRINFLNEFGLNYFGYSAAELIGKPVIGTIVPQTDSSGQDLAEQMQRVRADPRTFEQIINENMRRNGQRVIIAWTNRVVLDEHGELAEVLSVGTDVTARTRAEAALREANESLERNVAARTQELHAALIRAESADSLKSSFLATMSHELRTPLNSIIGFTGILLQRLPGPLNDEQAKQLGTVQSSARHLLDLINDILDISRIEAGRMEVRSEPFELGASIERVAASLRQAAKTRQIALDVIVPARLPTVHSDRRRVEQILLNLLNNAIKFTERGSVALSVEPVDDTASPERVRIHVRDTGIGIDAHDLATLFQPFQQVDSHLAREHKGSGLGLVICRRLAELLGGSIDAQSQPGVGSTFTLELPVNLEQPRPVTVEQAKQ